MSASVQPGDILLGKYRVERVLGQGGMGVVVAVRHVQLGELFAIKMLLPSARKNPDATERFLREARASARLKGEHVARVHDVGSLDDGAPYMVMEYLTGDDLKQILKRQGPFPLNELALFLHQTCEAVAEAHALGIVHRDLKPANLFLTRKPNGAPCVKVLDFGISKELEPAEGAMSDLTKTGTFMGSPPYMSPEQMADIKATDRRSDIWSLGIILYELSTGQLPFRAQAATELVAKVLTTEPPAPSELCPDIPPTFDAIVARCLEKKPDARYQTPEELAADLEPLITGSLAGLVFGSATRVGLSGTPSTSGMVAPATGSSSPSSSSARSAQAAAATPAVLAPTVNEAAANAPTKIEKSGAAPEVTHSGQTDGAWGNTSIGPARKDKKVLLLAAALLMGGVMAFVMYIVVKPADAPNEHVAEILPTNFAKPTPLVTVAAPEGLKRSTEPVAAPSAASAQPATSAVASAHTPTATKAGATPTASAKPAGTSTSSVAGFDD